jgi:hypothetical protein
VRQVWKKNKHLLSLPIATLLHQLTLSISFWTIQGIVVLEKLKYLEYLFSNLHLENLSDQRFLGLSLKLCDIATIFNVGLETDQFYKQASR